MGGISTSNVVFIVTLKMFKYSLALAVKKGSHAENMLSFATFRFFCT